MSWPDPNTISGLRATLAYLDDAAGWEYVPERREALLVGWIVVNREIKRIRRSKRQTRADRSV
jgi:hypothetical protein